MSFFSKKQLEARAKLKKKQSPLEWSGNDHLDATLEAINSTDVNEKLKSFYQTGKGRFI
jgi:hypothetical protein